MPENAAIQTNVLKSNPYLIATLHLLSELRLEFCHKKEDA